MSDFIHCFFRYFLRVTIVRRLSDITREMDLLVHTLSSYPEMNNSIKMEVGIEDCLHIEFEYNKSKWVQYVWLEKHCLIYSFFIFFYWMQHLSPSLETHTSTVCHFGFHFFMCTQVYNTTLSVQVPLKGCYCGQDIFFVGPHQDQAHGNRYHQERNNWLR